METHVLFLSFLTLDVQIVPLELLNTLLLDIQCMLQSEYEDYCVLGCSLLRMVCKIFGGTIKVIGIASFLSHHIGLTCLPR